MPTSRPTPQQHSERILITVRTYPTPSAKDVEVSCTAGITSNGEWIRLFPVPYRFLEPDKRFAKYQEIECLIHKASDSRPESYRVNLDSIKVVSDTLSVADNWAARRRRVEPLEAHCMCCIQELRDRDGSPTLGFFKPAEIIELNVELTTEEWSEGEFAKLRQDKLWRNAPPSELAKVPCDVKYHYRCPHPTCKGHRQSCTDWEVGWALLKWRKDYPDTWMNKFRQRFEDEMIRDNDTKFYVGTLRSHPSNWQIIGLWYPRQAEGKQLLLL